MSDPIQTIGQLRSTFPVQPSAGQHIGQARFGYGQEVGSFKDTLADALGDVQGLQDEATDAVDAFLRGDPVELHDVMAAVEEAGIALEMLVEVRNRFVEAYRTVISMQT